MSASDSPVTTAPPDSALPGLLGMLPEAVRPYVLLARLDRPVGIWLLYLPCVIGLFFTRIPTGFHAIDLWWLLLFFIGSVAMRGAGCTWNDITDRDLDAEVARTAARPLPSGQIQTWQAYAFMGLQLFIGFLVWLALPVDARIIALLALPLVAAYPFMKRITWWPQAWLGLTFNWGVLVAAATAATITVPTIILYAGLVFWTLAYDTIYAMQDVEDDALAGVKSTARLFGDRAGLAIFCFHMATAALIATAAWLMDAGRVGAVTTLAYIGHAIWQVSELKTARGKDALAIFKSNIWAGVIIAAGFAVAAIVKEPEPRSLFAEREILPSEEFNGWLPANLPIKRPDTFPAPSEELAGELPVDLLPVWTNDSPDGDIWMLTDLQRLSNERIAAAAEE